MSKILVVDDSESIQMLYSLEFADEGYEVFASKCDTQVFGQIEQKKPDVIVLDFKPGEYNGRNLLQDIRNIWSDVPVIVCTACPSFNLDQKSSPSECSLVKSSDLSELKHKVEIALRAKSKSQKKGTLEEIRNHSTHTQAFQNEGRNW